jgi:hypothetical protein
MSKPFAHRAYVLVLFHNGGLGYIYILHQVCFLLVRLCLS